MLNVAILGFGTVGSGVAEVLTMNKELLAKKVGQELNVKYILDTREFPGNPFESKIIHDFSVIENDPEVQLVAECIGGATIAYEFVKKCLQAGKHVATSNKELVAVKGYELLQIAKEKNVNFFFEASVGGGIPVLRPLSFDLAGNEITQVAGIMNGTTNYILTKMLGEGAAFADVLKDAQAKGYAEANPAADVEGLDACRKTCILSALSFGFHVYPDMVPTEGITKITEEDVAIAASANMKIKLLGRTMLTADGKVCAFVAPNFIPVSCPLAHVDDVFNAILVRGNAVNETMFYGPGAGKLPTASAVVGDLADAAWHLTARRDLDWADADESKMMNVRDLELPYIVRTNEPADKVMAALGEAEKLAADGYKLAKPMTLAQIEASGLQLTAVRPVFA
ncbi:MAG: homoserine dehydrogenase [Oscillospiraceae bacterium]|nr:homoserine dehydrogenase [Oscillospiraceae bacterium]